MKYKIAEAIGKKAKALKHCEKVIAAIDKHGKTEILLGNTGISIPCEKNDAIYTMLQSIRFKLVHEINSIEIVASASSRMLPAPNGACDEPRKMTCEICGAEVVRGSGRQKYCKECARGMTKEYNRRWRQKKIN